MAYQCELCEKKSSKGRSHTHHAGVAGGQWKKRAQTTMRVFKPNLHKVTLPIKGVMTRVRACTKCIKRIRFNENSVPYFTSQKNARHPFLSRLYVQPPGQSSARGNARFGQESPARVRTS